MSPLIPPPPVLASIDAMRPVFLIVMGLSLLLVAWRLSRRSSGWSGRTLLAGALLLAFGYGIVLPVYDLRLVMPPHFLMFFPKADAATVYGWHLTKLVTMNGGWLLFGLGLILHTRAFENLVPFPQRSPR